MIVVGNQVEVFRQNEAGLSAPQEALPDGFRNVDTRQNAVSAGADVRQIPGLELQHNAAALRKSGSLGNPEFLPIFASSAEYLTLIPIFLYGRLFCKLFSKFTRFFLQTQRKNQKGREAERFPPGYLMEHIKA